MHSVLVVGTGSIGERHVRCFQQTLRARVAIVEPNAAVRAAVAERYSVTAFADIDSALERERFSAAVIATPANHHIPIARQLAAANLHLLIEKPLSTSTAGLEQLLRDVQERQLVAAVAYVYRCFPALVEMRRAINSGQFGQPLQIVAVCGQHFPTYRPAYRDTYYTQHSSGGGAIQDALTHILNAGQWLVGPFTRVTADAAHLALPDVEVEDTVHVLARHGRVLGCYSLNQHQSPNETTISVICQHGTACFDVHRGSWRYMLRPDQPWQVQPFEALPRDAAFIAQANAFLDAVQLPQSPPCSLVDAWHTLAVNLAVLSSVKSGQWQEVLAPG